MKKRLKKLAKKLKSLKEKALVKAKALCKSTKKALSATKKLVPAVKGAIVYSFKVTFLGMFVAVSSFYSGTMHASFIEARVGDNTVYLQSPPGAELQGSGTGFEIKAPSGKVFTLTNAHVCGLAKDGIIMVGEKHFSHRLIPKRIIEIYADNDLCLVEGIEGYIGLEVANHDNTGDLVWSVGYPMGQGLNISSGRIKGFADVHIVDSETPLDKCNDKYHKVETYNTFFFGPVSYCVVTRFAAMTDVPTFPGNSGSPLVNMFGNVEGVVFASNNDTHWGSAVPLQDINNFLRPY